MNASVTPVLWTADAIARATGGALTRGFEASGVSIDSRTVKSGDLFIAIKGPNSDGHDYVTSALDRGAAGAIVHDDCPGAGDDAPLVRVADTFAALNDLGRAARARTHARVGAITGSVGKTGTKEALAHVLAPAVSVHASRGSLNNHWGVPLSLARMSPEAAVAIFEIGMNHVGEITPLAEMVRPHVALITTVEGAHKGNFSSLDEIADAKAEIFIGMDPGGTAVLNRDNRFFDRLSRAARQMGVETVLSFGLDASADIHLIDAALDGSGTSVTASVLGRTLRYRLGLPGRHWAINSLAVLGMVHALGADEETAALHFESFQAPKGRGAIHTIAVDGGTVTLIDESYNASPVSMNAAIGILALAASETDGRAIAVLGDMLELGADEAADHVALKEVLDGREVDQVFTAGPLMENLWNVLADGMKGAHAPDAGALAAMVTASLRPGDVVMVKGSAGIHMGRVVDAILAINGEAHTRAANGN